MSTLNSKRVRLRSGIALTTALALSAGASVLGAAAASAAPPQPPIDTSGFDSGRYIVVLEDDAMSTYRGGLPNLARTAPLGTDDIDVDSAAANAYAAHLETQQAEVASGIGAQIATNLTVTMNGFVADLSAEQALELARDSRVSQIFPDEMLQIQASPANEYLDLEGLWSQVGGVDEAGAGVVVGVLDTGIAPENPLFAGEPLGTTPGAEPYLDGDAIVFDKGDGSQFVGACETGSQFTAEDCSTKIITARYYVDGFGADNIGTETQEPGEYLSPRDGDGHGSHTASTAAGNAEVAVTSAGGADLGTMSGVAPEARIAAYKVCWSGTDPSSTDDDGCATSDSVAAIEQAVIDGVDVINFSIGGGAATSVATATDVAFLGAAAAGVFVSVSAGNSGPGASTLDHAAPWYTTVAAASIPNYEATVVLPGDERVPGGSITVPMEEGAPEISGPFIYAGDIAADGQDPAEAALCLPGTLDAAEADRAIVLCDRGVNARVEKSQVVADAGGIAAVLVNVTPGSIDLDDHVIPTIHVDAQYRDQLLAAAQTPGTVVSFEAGNTSGIETVAPVVAGFSSRGPALAEGSDVIKPDVASPGVGIIAAGPNPADGEPTYRMLSGTSMAAPHVAGLGAIYLGAHPNASPAEVKSALMTTATDTRNLDGSVSTDPWAQGAGFVNTQSMLDAGLVYENGTADWFGYLRGLGYVLPDSWVGTPMDPSDLNIASIAVGSLAGTQTVTRTVTALEASSYAVSTSGMSGIDVAVSPSTLEFTEAGQSLSYEVTFTTAGAELGAWTSGFLTWTSSEHTVRSPLAVKPVAVAAPEWVEGMGTVGQTPVSGISGIDGSIPLEANGLAPFQLLGADGGDAGDYFQYVVEIPEGEIAHYFSLDAEDDTADHDLYVLRLNDAGTPVEQFTAATGSADETLLLEDPQAGTYVAIAEVWATGEAGAPSNFELDHVAVGTGQQEGSFRTEPTSIDGTVGGHFTYTAMWNGLDTNAEYLGVVGYGGTDVRTFVHVTTGDLTMPTPERLEGDDRYETAVAISQHGFPEGADVVYVASGQKFPDGLAAAPAAAREGGPLLLTQGGALPDVVAEEIERLSPERIVIVGGEPSVAPAVADELEGLAGTVDRVGGADRYETSRLIAQYAFEEGSANAFVATGRNYPDALSAGAAAGSIDAPILLVDGLRDGADDASVAELDRLGAENVYLLGDQNSMSNGIELDFDLLGLVVHRFAGSDRYQTAVLVNQEMFDGPVPAMYLASGQKFPDALSASALAAAEGSPLYLAKPTCINSAIVTESLRLGQPPVFLLGSEATLSSAVEEYAICP
ncbi:cell wall-binding repeat-containing protein [Agrococcus sp. SCSIO52902]|uniref:cell wall-binding repeat-containing protein n=1 Tax=Agrococcus sp. SCSIO52902 TaxID=2933290 RepID=UPI002486B299|nr:cell wall-binding repeat-containing protein [Agrococcus sp. SCSIO52902]